MSRRDSAAFVVDRINQCIARVLTTAAKLHEIDNDQGANGRYGIVGAFASGAHSARNLDSYLDAEGLVRGLHELDLRFPAALQARLDTMLDKQDGGGLSARERDEAHSLVDQAELLSVLRLRTRCLSTDANTPTYAEHDVVVLDHDVPDDGLVEGEVGTVVGVYACGGGYEVEFTGAGGAPVVVTLTGRDVRPRRQASMSVIVLNRLKQLNERLATVGDPAQLRYVLIENDPHVDGEQIATVTAQLPQATRADTRPIATVDRYRKMIAEHLKPLPISTVSCLVRTAYEATPLGVDQLAPRDLPATEPTMSAAPIPETRSPMIRRGAEGPSWCGLQGARR